MNDGLGQLAARHTLQELLQTVLIEVERCALNVGSFPSWAQNDMNEKNSAKEESFIF